MTETTTPVRPRALPRRVNGIRELAKQMADVKLAETNARQAISDRIGYAVAVAGGAELYRVGGWRVIAAVVALYVVSGIAAVRRYRALRKQSAPYRRRR